jgi:hypothetical protein
MNCISIDFPAVAEGRHDPAAAPRLDDGRRGVGRIGPLGEQPDMRRFRLGTVVALAMAPLVLNLAVLQVSPASADAPHCDPNARVRCRTEATQSKTVCMTNSKHGGAPVWSCDSAYRDQLNRCMAAAHCPVYGAH